MGVGSTTEKDGEERVEAFSPKVETGTTPPPPAHTPLTGDQGTQRRLQKISDNTGGMLQETKKRIGPGDIVFKNLPRALAVRGEWQESKLSRTSAAIAPPLAPVVAAAAAPVVQAMLPRSDVQATAPEMTVLQVGLTVKFTYICTTW